MYKETFRDTFVTSSDVKDIVENMDDTSCNIKMVMGNGEKDAEQDKTKNLTSKSGQIDQNPVTSIEKEKSMLINASELKNVSSEKSGNQ